MRSPAPALRAALLLAVLLSAACGAEPGANGATSGAGPAEDAACTALRAGVTLPPELNETSGAAASRRHPGVLWMHNDSNNEDALFAVRESGELAGRVAVQGARNRDWEDLALAACDGGDCLFIADTGDNDAERDEVVVYRVPEPDPADARTAPAAAFAMRYPGGPRDAEALFVLPGQQLYLITKGRGAPIELFRYPGPLRTGETVTLERVRELGGVPGIRGQLVTAADATPDGAWIAVRTYGSLALFRADSLLAGGGPAATARLTDLQQPQGEGVALAADGVVVLTSEGGSRSAPASLALARCAPPAG